MLILYLSTLRVNMYLNLILKSHVRFHNASKQSVKFLQ